MSSSTGFEFFFFVAFVKYTTETRLLLAFSLKSERCSSVLKFFFNNVIKDKSV